MNSLFKLLRAWKHALLAPERIKGGEFSLGFMLTVSFYLGFIYNTVHYFIYPGYIKSHFYAGSTFWIHSLYGGTSGIAFFLFVSILGYLSVKSMGKNVSYEKIEHLVFSCTFLYILPLLFAIPLLGLGYTQPTGGVKMFKLVVPYLPPFKVVSCVIITAIAATIIAFRILNRALGFTKRQATLSVLLAPLTYVPFKWSFLVLIQAFWSLTGTPLSPQDQFLIGVLYALVLGGTTYSIRMKIVD